MVALLPQKTSLVIYILQAFARICGQTLRRPMRPWSWPRIKGSGKMTLMWLSSATYLLEISIIAYYCHIIPYHRLQTWCFDFAKGDLYVHDVNAQEEHQKKRKKKNILRLLLIVWSVRIPNEQRQHEELFHHFDQDKASMVAIWSHDVIAITPVKHLERINLVVFYSSLLCLYQKNWETWLAKQRWLFFFFPGRLLELQRDFTSSDCHGGNWDDCAWLSFGSWESWLNRFSSLHQM